MRIPETPPNLNELIKKVDKETLVSLFRTHIAQPDEYLHWSKLKYKKPLEFLNHETWWLIIKLARQQQYKTIPMKDKNGQNFKYILTNKIQKACHEIDSKSRGSMLLDTNNKTIEKEQYIFMSLVEEAFTSSFIEGAVSTRHDAINMIHKGRRPKNKSEKMILNNYIAMQSIQEYSREKLSFDLIKNLHTRITRDTLDDPGFEGKFQTEKDERIAIYDNRDNTLLFKPPNANEIEARLSDLILFANSEDGASFIHPVVKAIIIHFWLAYIHPFEDGNGRLARSLFYKSMLCDSYWLFEYISISSIIKNAPAKYSKAFLLTETDDNDLTYFIHHQLDCIIMAIENVENYIQEKVNKIKILENKLKGSDFNHRQLSLLSHALRHPNEEYSIKSHKMIHSVSYATSRSDLLFLEEICLLDKTKRGNEFVWIRTKKFNEVLDALSF